MKMMTLDHEKAAREADERDAERRIAAWVTGSDHHKRESLRAQEWARIMRGQP